jgi:hypothetical protein
MAASAQADLTTMSSSWLPMNACLVEPNAAAGRIGSQLSMFSRSAAGVLNFFRLVYIYYVYTAAYSVDFFTSAGAVKWGGWDYSQKETKTEYDESRR